MAFFINVLYMKFPSTNKTEFLVYEEFSSVFLTRRGIIVYLEYQSAWPFDGIGSPTPSPPSECGSPPRPKWGGKLACGGPNCDEGTELWYSMFTIIPLRSDPSVVINDHCIFCRSNYRIE